MSKVKICGIRELATVKYLNQIKPDFAGFILSDKFWRFAEDFQKIRPELDGSIKCVGVFVDNPLPEVANFIKSGIIDYAQLHGSEDGDYIKSLQALGGKIIKAFKIACDDDLENAYKSPADLVLLDSGTGTGERFDWTLLRDFGRDYILAGGLDPDNVGEAVDRFSPYAVDVSSGVETDRKKDNQKIEKFINEVKNHTQRRNYHE